MKRSVAILVTAALCCAGCEHHYKRAALATEETTPAAVPASDSYHKSKTQSTPVSESSVPAYTTSGPLAPGPGVTPLGGAPAPQTTEPAASLSTDTPANNPAPTGGLPEPGDAPTVAKMAPVAPTPTPEQNVSQQQVVVVTTSLGNIVIELNDYAAPKTCVNFRKLAANGFYDHTSFHRVIPHFMIQGGDPNSKSNDRESYGLGGPGYALPAEISLKHERGSVAMARLPDAVNPHRASNGSQFYICDAACPSLDDQYTVFGHVIQGMDVVDQIASQPRDARDNPTTKIEMSVTLEDREKALNEKPATP